MLVAKYMAALALSSGIFLCGMDNAMCPAPALNATVPLQQGLRTALINFDNVYRGLPHAATATSSTYPITNQQVKYDATLNDFLDWQADREVCHRNEKAKRIGGFIDAEYVGDSWMRTIALHARFSGSLCTVEDKVAVLGKIYSAFSSTMWDTPLIDSVRAHSNHFDSLLGGLITEKERKFCLYHQLLKGSDVDGFFNVYPNLPTPFRQYIQDKIEQDYRHSCMKGDQSKTVVFHILFSALRHSYGEELKALLMSCTYKKHELATDFAFACSINDEGPENLYYPVFSMICENKDKVRKLLLADAERDIQPE